MMKPGRPGQKDNLYIRDARVGLGPITIPGLNVPIGLRRAVGPETSREAGSSSMGSHPPSVYGGPQAAELGFRKDYPTPPLHA